MGGEREGGRGIPLRKFTAVHIYIAVCYYKLDFFENALEFIKAYIMLYPDSLYALNLQNCCNFRLGKTINVNPPVFPDS